MSETRKLAAILVADVVGYSRLVGADEDGTLGRLRELRRALIDPTVADHNGRVVKRTGDGAVVGYRSAVDAVRCAIAVQRAMIERNADIPEASRIVFRMGVHVGDVVEETDGDLMGDGLNVAARLEGVCEPGGVCLSGAAYEHVRDRLKESFVEFGEKSLKNIARPVRVYGLDFTAQGHAPDRSAVAPETRPPPHLSIVVLPFVNLGSDPEQEYFVDGVTESLTTDLCRIADAFVIARNTAFTFKGKPLDVKAIGRELNVRYFLEGSVQRGGSRMRINVQLIDAESGHHLWAERFDKPIADLFDMQDEIVAQLANTLRAKLVADIAARAERKPNADSTDFHFQGLAWFNKGYTPENLTKAREYFQRALDADPNNLTALLWMAGVDLTIATNYQGADHAVKFASVEAAVAKVLSLRPDDALAHLLFGLLQIFTRRGAEGIAELEHALALDPNLAAAHAELGMAMLINGRAGETEARVKEALRLSPRDPFAYLWVAYQAGAKLVSSHDDEPVALYRRSIELYRNYPMSHLQLAAALQLLGRPEEARKEAGIALQLNPRFTIRLIRASA
jgi:TolB-like protein/class 3 adenylate cyclase/Tfp pilus assembly protein PilF